MEMTGRGKRRRGIREMADGKKEVDDFKHAKRTEEMGEITGGT
jgi:hypothetical protein